jgi:hypothetical protein
MPAEAGGASLPRPPGCPSAVQLSAVGSRALSRRESFTGVAGRPFSFTWPVPRPATQPACSPQSPARYPRPAECPHHQLPLAPFEHPVLPAVLQVRSITPCALREIVSSVPSVATVVTEYSLALWVVAFRYASPLPACV